jgi:hypothetical protein
MDSVQDDLARLTKSIASLVKDRDAMRHMATRATHKPDDSELTAVLNAALNGEDGWRERARQVLGITRQLPCELCGTLFPSGGKRRQYCSEQCRLDAYGKKKRL